MPAHRSTTRQRDRRSNDPKYNDFINETLERIRNKEFSSYREASRVTKIPKSTLTDRGKNRHTDWASASAKQQTLTPAEETALLNWAIHQGSIGMPYSYADLRAEASAICGKEVGKTWHRKFERRHPELRAARPAKLDPKRAKNFNEAIISDYFDKLEELHGRYPGGVPPEHIWNMDEKGIQMGGGRKKSTKKYYYFKDQKQRYRISSDNLELVTILECISASGEVVPPSFCLQNGGAPDLRELNDNDWGSIYFSESGWTDTYNCERWLEEVFIPFAKKCRVDRSKPIVLTMDGHDTHEKPELQCVVYKHLDEEDLEIVIFCFPSKCTHKCQPLDVLVFSSVERKWQDVCDRCVKEKTPINRFTIIPEYVRGTRGALSKDFIMKAFEKTGVYPVKRTVFTKEDFAPSKVTSSIAHVPDDFPQDFPSSDPIEIDPDYEASIQSNSESESDSEMENDLPSDGDDLGMDSDDSDAEDLNSDDERQPDFEPEDDNANISVNSDGSDQTLTNEDPDSAPQPISGLLHSLAAIETSVIHMTRSATARLDLFTTPPPKTVSAAEDRRRSFDELFHEVRMLRKQVFAKDEAIQHALGQLSAANAHCTSIHRELGAVRQELENATKKKQPRSSKKVRARFLTSAGLRAEFEREDAERREREKATAEKEKQKEADTAQRALRVADDALNRVFAGRLTSYKKDDLRALAIALSLSDKGTNTELTTRIQNCFNTHPDLKRNTRFSSLFQQGRRRNIEQRAEDEVDDSHEERDGPPNQDRHQDQHAHMTCPPAPAAVVPQPRLMNAELQAYNPYPNPPGHPIFNQHYYQEPRQLYNHYNTGHWQYGPAPSTSTNLQFNYYNAS